MPRLTAAAIAAACLLAGPAFVGGDAPQPFALGVLRQDGVLLPFAAFDGRKWTNAWPLVLQKQAVPISLDDVPDKWWPGRRPHVDWTLWTAGGDARAIKATAPCVARVLCNRVIGLRTTAPLSAPLPAPDEQPYPKLGLVTTGDHPIEPITTVAVESAEWRMVETLVRSAFDTAETEAVSAEARGGWIHPVKEAERRAQPPAFEAMYRAPFTTPGSVVYYVEGTRRYLWRQPGGDMSCDLVTFGGGSITVDRGGTATFDIQARVTDCQRWPITAMLPLGVLRLDDQFLWIGQWSGWSREAYAVVALDAPLRARTVIQTVAGSCW